MRLRCLMVLAAALVLSACAAKERVVLLPGGTDSEPGTVAFLTDDTAETAVLSAAYSEARIDSDGQVATGDADAIGLIKEYLPLLNTLPKAPQSFVLYFLMGATTLAPISEPVLSKIFAEIAARQNDGVDVQVVGHTDTVGSQEANDALSLKRAIEVRDQLIQQGLDAGLVSTAGRGERDLLQETGDDVANFYNRRVEVIVR